MTEKTEYGAERTLWKSLPPLGGGVWVAMVTEVLDNEGIPNVVKTDLEGGGLGRITGTQQIGRPWRIQVPEEYYDRALNIYESLLAREGGDEAEDKSED
ncbi:DUF2007 domain-containing protein [bacterium]|nr:DUF2007 domain-containing protein [bacterium]MBU1983630.1 DUF2007 domain-containing protein [bacterium]